MGNMIKMTEHGYGIAFFNRAGTPSAFLFDECDLPLVRAHTWRKGYRGYPMTTTGKKTIALHKLLFPETHGLEVDHINGNKLDNRRSNLRLCTHRQNACNQRRRITNTSGYIGVHFRPERNSYEAYIRRHGHKLHLGSFPDAIMAANVRDTAARSMFGEYAKLNFPDTEKGATRYNGAVRAGAGCFSHGGSTYGPR